MATAAQMRHLESIARHIREQASERLTAEMESIERFSQEDPDYWRTYPIGRGLERVEQAIASCEDEIASVMRDMAGELKA